MNAKRFAGHIGDNSFNCVVRKGAGGICPFLPDNRARSLLQLVLYYNAKPFVFDILRNSTMTCLPHYLGASVRMKAKTPDML